MKVFILLLLLANTCFSQEEDPIPSHQIGDEVLVKNVFGDDLTLDANTEEGKQKVFEYKAPRGWRILEILIQEIEKDEGTKVSHFFPTDKEDMALKKVLEEEKNKTYALLQQNPGKKDLEEYFNFLSLFSRTFSRVSVVLEAKNLSVMGTFLPVSITVRVDAKMLYVGEVETSEEEKVIPEEKILRAQISKPKIKIHPQTYIDIISETSYLLSHKMKSDEEEVARFIRDFESFSKKNKVVFVNFEATDDDRSIFCNITYDLLSNEVNTLPMRKNIYGLSNFLKKAKLVIYLKTDKEIVDVPKNWEKIDADKVAIAFPYGDRKEFSLKFLYSKGK